MFNYRLYAMFLSGIATPIIMALTKSGSKFHK